ncbi:MULTISPECIES: short chain dehydrogenase [unclassified Burkholderia]|uniref:short chain dehydrogenase n=1 Tax=unclassified Burkholderia TaxID=2613784 RepID=UPI000F55FF60|nr:MULTISPECIES: short chain dehydrogenase [unclassified Burkholderia]RQR41266.1 short chain dehydrogenase [Burkholderia sp. Bp9142]RQR52792.1 short chain dehydrogenase [Burkholderia sp. Bp9140]
MSKIVVIGATGTIGKAAVAALRPRHEIIEVGATRGDRRVNVTDPKDIQRLFESIGKVDHLIVSMGAVHFGPFEQMTSENFLIGLHDKLMGQVNTVLVGQSWLNDGGSFTLTSGISAHEPVRDGSNASCVNLALEGFVRGAAVDLKRGMRINLVSPTMLEESVELFSAAFPGFEPVSSARVGLAYVRSVEGPETGRVYRVGYC